MREKRGFPSAIDYLRVNEQHGDHSFVTTLYLSNRNHWELPVYCCHILLYKYCVPIGPDSTARKGNYILAMECDRRCRTINSRMTSPPNGIRRYVVVRSTIFDNSQRHAGQLLRKETGTAAFFFPSPIIRYIRERASFRCGVAYFREIW